jgi:hypothetical protein
VEIKMGCNCGKKKFNSSYNVLNAASDVITGKAEFVDDETYNKRVEICINCPGGHYSKIFKACTICKCFIKTKAKFKESSCPAAPYLIEQEDGSSIVFGEENAPYWEEVK